MGQLKLVVRVFINFLKNVYKLLRFKKMYMPSFGSMTVDYDDVKIANSELKNKESWYDNEIIAEYESEFAKWNGSENAFSFMGGREALSACIFALGLKKGDKVIIPGYTCVVVPNAFWFEGIEVIFCDIELETYGIDYEDLKKKFSSDVKAILIQHLYGLVSKNYELVIDFAKEHNVFTIEDCAHSTGATLNGIKVGNKGDVSFYSSENSKIINTCMGGIAITNNDLFAEKIKEYQSKLVYPSNERIESVLKAFKINYYLQKNKYNWLIADLIKLYHKNQFFQSTTFEELHFKKPLYYGQKMPACIAKLGLNQLKKVDSYNGIRRESALYWDIWCDKNDFKKPVVINNSIPVYLRYPVLVTEKMKENHSWAIDLNVPIGMWFNGNLHPVSFPIKDCPNADLAVIRCINFPTIGLMNKLNN